MSWVDVAVSQQCLCVPSFIRSLTLYIFYFSSSLSPEFVQGASVNRAILKTP